MRAGANCMAIISSRFIRPLSRPALTAVSVAAIAVACHPEDVETDAGSAMDDEDEVQDNTYALPPAIGGAASGGAGGGPVIPPTMCEGTNAFRQAYVCAGSVSESRQVTHRTANLTPIAPVDACMTAGTHLLPASDSQPTAAGALPAGGAGGISGYGGAGGRPGTSDPWCGEAPEHTAIAGVTYSLDDCDASELALPIVFQEPEHWYRLKVFVGDSACERGELVADTAGYGTGEVVALDVDPADGTFVTLEFTAELENYHSYYWDPYYGYYYGPYYAGDTLRVELEPIAPSNTTGP